MCFRTPKAAPVQRSPQRDGNASLVQESRRAVASAGGVFSNIVNPLGDSTYGTNTGKPKLAKLGGS